MSSFTPLRDAVVGEQARYVAMDNRILEYRVTEVTTSDVTTRVVVLDQGKPLGQPATRVDGRDTDLLAAEAGRVKAQRRASSETIQATGRTWEATCYQDRWIDEGVSYVRRTWVSPAVPVFGIIRMELHGADRLEARLELVDLRGGR